MSSELNEIKNKSPYLELSNSYSETKKRRYEIFYDYSRKKEKSIITDLFYSILGKTLKCECNKEFYVFQKLLDIPLLINNNQKEITIEALIDNFLKEILVDLNDSCSNCKKIKKNILYLIF
jgi:ubiquitin C-terminal hydrolase